MTHFYTAGVVMSSPTATNKSA